MEIKIPIRFAVATLGCVPRLIQFVRARASSLSLAEVVMVHVSSLPGNEPKAGDVILTRTNGASHRYTIATSGGAPQIACTTFEEAITQADAFARCHNVDVWHTDDGRVFTRIVEGHALGAV